MTQEQADNLKPGDIVEHVTKINYWLAKLVSFQTDRKGIGYWTTKNHGTGSEGVSCCTLPRHPENFHLVGHSCLE